MRTLTRTGGLFLAACLVMAAPMRAQEHVVTQDELQAAVDGQASREAEDRAFIRRLLQRPEVRRVAGEAGLDVQRARAAAATLEGEELDRVAGLAREADAALVGGDVYTITSTTLIIILLVLILIIVA